MKIDDVLQCSFQNWYPSFKKFTPESIIIPLPDGFVDYLHADSIILPESEEPKYANSAGYSDDENEWNDDDDDETDVPEPPKFKEFDLQIKDSIQRLGGKVFPKLNWSSARDASWIGLNNSCCCTTVSDVYLLLKTSPNIINHDLTGAFSYCEDHPEEDSSESSVKNSQSVCVPYCLVLRKWIEIDPSTEFRCFVKNNSLIGISQREHSVYFGHIGQQKNEIVKDIVSFFNECVQHKFPSCNYVFDVFREKKDNVTLVDFNPFGEVTDSLLFEWSELKENGEKTENNNLPEFRYVVDNHGIQPKLFCQCSLPTDIVDISTGMDSVKLVDLLKMKMGEQSNEDSSDEE